MDHSTFLVTGFGAIGIGAILFVAGYFCAERQSHHQVLSNTVKSKRFEFLQVAFIQLAATIISLGAGLSIVGFEFKNQNLEDEENEVKFLSQVSAKAENKIKSQLIVILNYSPVKYNLPCDINHGDKKFSAQACFANYVQAHSIIYTNRAIMLKTLEQYHGALVFSEMFSQARTKYRNIEVSSFISTEAKISETLTFLIESTRSIDLSSSSSEHISLNDDLAVQKMRQIAHYYRLLYAQSVIYATEYCIVQAYIKANNVDVSGVFSNLAKQVAFINKYGDPEEVLQANFGFMQPVISSFGNDIAMECNKTLKEWFTPLQTSDGSHEIIIHEVPQ